MRKLAQFICFSLLVFTFSCDTDELFDSNNQAEKLAGEWQVVSVESISYSSTMISASGQSDTSIGEFTGEDINMSITFNADNTFSTSGDYNQVLTIETPLPNPVVIEDRFNDFVGGGTWEFENSALLIQNIAETVSQRAEVGTFTDTEIDFDYAYTCLLYTSPSPRDATLSRMPSSA